MQNDEVTATYLYGTNLLSTNNGTSTSYYLFNAHGDVTGITDSAQTVTKTYDYDAYGSEINPSATDTNPFRYCGEYFDKETGTYYLRARYYDPAIGRFTQQDTHWNTGNMIHGDDPAKAYPQTDELGLTQYTYRPDIDAITQSNNLYVYCTNNPVYYNDSSGNIALIASIGLKVFKGVAIQYIGDVFANITSGKTGTDILIPTSTAGEYLAAGISELVPGSGVTKSIISSVLEESIIITENVIKGNNINIATSLRKVASSSTLDFVGGEITTFIQKKSDSLIPKNYSTYAHSIRKVDHNISNSEIRNYYNSYVKSNEVVKKVVSSAVNIVKDKAKDKIQNKILLMN